ncbi:MAG: cysteine hydrolase [Solirubrobacteraceae bacterium]|nr:cysteine hydrolase [Solirubrobacteraceae bacterium]
MSKSALIVIDMLNRYDHEDAEPLRASVREVTPVLADLIESASAQDALVVYVNDNHGDWTAGRSAIARDALAGRAPELVEPIVPGPQTPFLVKARHSAFYATQLEYMLREQGVERVVLTGQVTEQCVFYTALDAYVRHFGVTVPRDAVAHIHGDLAEAALRMMESNMRADIVDAAGALDALRQ